MREYDDYDVYDDDDDDYGEDYGDDYDEDDDLDYCYECGGYGDDYFINDNGELECYCPQCPMNPSRSNWNY